MDAKMRELLCEAGAAARDSPLKKLNPTGKHAQTKAYQLEPTEEWKRVVEYILMNKLDSIDEEARKAGLVRGKFTGSAQFQIDEGSLPTKSTELSVIIPYDHKTKVLIEDGSIHEVDGMSIVGPQSNFRIDPSTSVVLLLLFNAKENSDKGKE